VMSGKNKWNFWFKSTKHIISNFWFKPWFQL
jgi:hypothetical protein